MSIRISSFTIARSVLLCALTFVFSSVSHAQPRGGTEKIRITYAANNLGFLQMFVAKDRGFYAASGLEVELIRTSTAAGIGALLSGDADYTKFLGSALRAAAKGAPIRAVSIGLTGPFFSLAARPQFKTVKDLKGGTVGVTAIAGSNYVSTKILLQHYGLDPDRDVKPLSLGDHNYMFEALKLGRVDAVTINPPYSVLLKREGFLLLADAAKVVSFPFGGLATTLKKIHDNRAQVKKVLKAELEALRYIHKQAQGTTDLISRRFAMEHSVAAESYRLVIGAFSDGKISLQGVEKLLDSDKADGAILKSVTVNQVVDVSLVEEVLRDMPAMR
jgi:ABC-type nitrate/sulfonate/bicarbonate transport system substrate-binding protein